MIASIPISQLIFYMRLFLYILSNPKGGYLKTKTNKRKKNKSQNKVGSKRIWNKVLRMDSIRLFGEELLNYFGSNNYFERKQNLLRIYNNKKALHQLLTPCPYTDLFLFFVLFFFLNMCKSV